METLYKIVLEIESISINSSRILWQGSLTHVTPYASSSTNALTEYKGLQVNINVSLYYLCHIWSGAFSLVQPGSSSEVRWKFQVRKRNFRNLQQVPFWIALTSIQNWRLNLTRKIQSYSKIWDFHMALTQNSFSTLNLLTNIFQNNFNYVQHWFIISEGFKVCRKLAVLATILLL